MRSVWHRIESWLAGNAIEVLNSLFPGATDQEIQQAEALLGISFPEDLKDSYRIHNGQRENTFSLIYGGELLSLENILGDYQLWQEVSDGVNWNQYWIPLTRDVGGNHCCLDLDPTRGSEVGRIIFINHEIIPEIEAVLADSFRSWLEEFANELEKEIYIFSEEYKGLWEREEV